MSMKAHIETDPNGNIIVRMEGGLDYETTGSLKDELNQLGIDNPTSLITLDMSAVDFVGSSGIGQFVATVKELKLRKANLHLKNVRDEFLKVFKLYNLESFQAIIEDFESDETQDLGAVVNRSLTFEN